MVHAGLMSERALLVMASQHQQPAEVSTCFMCPYLSVRGDCKVGGSGPLRCAPGRARDAHIHQMALAEV